MNNGDELLKRKGTQANEILRSINKELRAEFEKSKGIMLNPNTKGGEYEKAISKILQDYLGSRFEFHVRAHLLDAQMEYLQLFSAGENEIDITATFSNASPRIVLKIGDTRYIPFDAVAFTIDTKSRLDKQKLERDLDKLTKITNLKKTPPRKGDMMFAMFATTYYLDRPLRCLFYFESSINERELESSLMEKYSVWDIILIIDNNRMLLNRSLPIVSQMMTARSIEGPILGWGGDNCFIVLLNILSATIPIYQSVDVMQTFLNLDYFSKL